MANEHSELHERAEHGAAGNSNAPVTITLAILAVLVAVVSLLDRRSHAQELLLQVKSTDQWAQYQAKDLRERSYEVFLDQLSVLSLADQAHARDLKAKYQSEIERYHKELADIMTAAGQSEAGQKLNEQRGNRFDLGEVLIEAAFVICAITLLTRKRIYWLCGLALGLVGLVIAATAFLIR